MIRTVEIPRQHWASFLETLSRIASGRPVRLEVARRELGDQEMANFSPLRELDFERKGSERGELIVSVGGERGELTHLVAQPLRIAVGVNETNEPQWLAIEEPDEATTIVHFEALPALDHPYGATP